MCGLFGWQFQGETSKKQMRILASVLSSEMDHRGGDSWGYYASDICLHNRGNGLLSFSRGIGTMMKARSIIGHTRKATTGKIHKDNAHPFMLAKVVGAHNGIVSNHDELNAVYDRQCSVDSQHIFHHIQDEQDLGEIEAYGAIAFQWIERPDEIRLGKFNDGELCIAQVENGIVWASTYTAVRKATSLSGINIKTTYQVDEGKEYLARDGKLFDPNKKLGFSKPVYFRSWRDGLKDKKVSGNTSHSMCSISDMNDDTFQDKYVYDEETDKWLLRTDYERDWTEFGVDDDLTEEQEEELRHLRDHGYDVRDTF